MLVEGCFLQDHSALVMIWFHVALTFPSFTSISGFLRLDPDLTRMRLGSNAQRIYMLVGLKRLSTFTIVVDSHLIPGFTSLVGLTTVGLSLALHNRVVMELVEMIVIDTLHIVYFVKYDDTVSFMTLYPIQ